MGGLQPSDGGSTPQRATEEKDLEMTREELIAKTGKFHEQNHFKDRLGISYDLYGWLLYSENGCLVMDEGSIWGFNGSVDILEALDGSEPLPLPIPFSSFSMIKGERTETMSGEVRHVFENDGIGLFDVNPIKNIKFISKPTQFWNSKCPHCGYPAFTMMFSCECSRNCGGAEKKEALTGWF